MTSDHFEATFVVATDRQTAWERLTENPLDPTEGDGRVWLPGFDSAVTVMDLDEGTLLRVTKDDEPCAGTKIVVTLVEQGTGTRVTVVQSGFGDWMAPLYDVMSVGWRHIVSDLETYLSTGVHPRRHFRPWGDLGADVVVEAGGLRLQNVRPDTLASRLELRDSDLLVLLAGAPVSCHDDLVTVLRVVDTMLGEVTAETIRDGVLVTTCG